MKNKMSDKEKIVVIDLLYMGDLIFATPFFKQLRKNYIDSKIDIIVNSNFYDLIEDNPYFDNVIAYDKKWSIKESYKFAKKIKKGNYDLGINIHGNWRTILLMYLISPDYNIGYGGDGKSLFLDKTIKTSDNLHMVKVYLQFLEKMDLKSFEDDSIELKVNKEAKKNMNELINTKIKEEDLSKKKRLIALNTGGTWSTKRWPKIKFAKLADKIKDNGEEVIFIGGPSDKKRVKDIISLMKNNRVINATGKTSLKELAALVKKSDLVISNDSGPVHVAAAVGTKTITIFGPSDEKKYRPYGEIHEIITNEIDCRPCGEHECPLGHHNCMEKIEVEEVMKLVKR